MHVRPVAALLIASLWWTQLPAAAAQQTPAPDTVTVPSGTLVPLTLTSPIKHKSTKVGDTVRAQVAFPITVGDQIAIPANTVVEGVIVPAPAKVKGQKKPANQPPVFVHFTKLIYANGYTASLDAVNTAAVALPSPAPAPVQDAMLEMPRAHGPSPEASFAPEPQFPTPTPPTDPYSHAGPTTKELVAFTLGPVIFVSLILLLVHFALPHGDYVVEAAGWQFQMTLQSPLTLSTSSVDAAAATPAK